MGKMETFPHIHTWKIHMPGNVSESFYQIDNWHVTGHKNLPMHPCT